MRKNDMFWKDLTDATATKAENVFLPCNNLRISGTFLGGVNVFFPSLASRFAASSSDNPYKISSDYSLSTLTRTAEDKVRKRKESIFHFETIVFCVLKEKKGSAFLLTKLRR